MEQLYQNQQYNEVIQLANSLIESQKYDVNTFYYKGLAENALYQFKESSQSFERALAYVPESKLFLFSLAGSLESEGNTVKAITTYKKLIALDTLHIPAKAQLAKIYKAEKEYLKAMELYSDLIKIDTNNGYFYSQLAYCCNKFGLQSPVIGFYEKAIQLNPNDITSCKQLISELIDQKYYEDAIYYIDTFLTRFNDDLYLLKRKAYISAIGGNYLDAVQEFEKVISLGDTSMFTCKYYGQSLYNNGEYEKAVIWLDKYLKYNNDDTKNQFVMAMACQMDYQYQKSIDHFDIALWQVFDKELIARIYKEKGNTYVKYGDYVGFRDSTGTQAPQKYNDAKDNYLLSLEMLPDKFSIYEVLGEFYEKKIKDLKIALYYYEKYYKEMDTDQISEDQFVWIQSKITQLKEEVHFIGE